MSNAIATERITNIGKTVAYDECLRSIVERFPSRLLDFRNKFPSGERVLVSAFADWLGFSL